MTELAEPATGQAGRYRHEALLYSGRDEFLAGTAALIRRAAAAGQPVLAVLSPGQLDLLRAELGPAPSGVRFADMAQVGGNPARIISTWRAFADENADADLLWGIGEAVYPARSAAELTECQLYEGLLNIAIEAGTPLRLLCPYDVQALAADVVAAARRSHPYLSAGGEDAGSADFRPFDAVAEFARPLSPPRPGAAAVLPFALGGLRAVRTFTAGQARQSGFSSDRIPAVVAAVNEIATNSLQHGGGHGQVYSWPADGMLLFEVADQGHFAAPMAGRLRPAGDSGAGLWLANQICDLVQISATPAGTTVRLYCRS